MPIETSSIGVSGCMSSFLCIESWVQVRRDSKIFLFVTRWMSYRNARSGPQALRVGY